MKLNFAVFFDSTEKIAQQLNGSETFQLVDVGGEYYALRCRFVSSDPYYLNVEIPRKGKKGLTLMIPHSIVRLAMYSESEKALGFVGQ